jgi:hypothetical protein
MAVGRVVIKQHYSASQQTRHGEVALLSRQGYTSSAFEIFTDFRLK